MRITSKGQVTIPIEIREKMGFLPDTEVKFKITGNTVFLERVESSSKRSLHLINQMHRKATVKMTTDEILSLTRG